jgi:hypothetical protein
MFDLLSGKDKKRAKLAMNKYQGNSAEAYYQITAPARGTRLERKPHGRDYDEWDTDILGRKKGKKRFIEIKTGNAKLSKLQKKTMRKHKKRYSVMRFD